MSITLLDSPQERCVEKFESALAEQDDVAPRDFLPARNEGHYLETLVEILRVYVDWRYANNVPIRLQELQLDYPDAFTNVDLLSQLAFEEYRARHNHGETPTVEEYTAELAIDTSEWPVDMGFDGFETVQAGSTIAGARGAEPLHLQPGDDWEGFRIQAVLGRGTFGVAYLAEQVALAGRQVVLKFAAQNLHEAEKLAQLQHTNITPVYSVHDSPAGAVICMPYLGSVTLADVIRSIHEPTAFNSDEDSSPPDEGILHLTERQRLGQSLSIIHRLADGLHHAHQKGIVHRDVKPANVLMRDDGEPLLIDFNLATSAEQTPGSIGGTLPYMSPEMLMAFARGNDHHAVDLRADVYGLGVVMHELLTGQLPHAQTAEQAAEPSNVDLVRLARQREHRTTIRLSARLTPAVASIVARCLEPCPEKRYRTAAELRDDIKSHLEDRPLQYAPNRSLRESLAKWGRRHPRLCSWTSAGILLLAAITSMAFAWRARETKIAVIRAQNRFHQATEALGKLRPSLVASTWSPERLPTIREKCMALSESLNLDSDAAISAADGDLPGEDGAARRRMRTEVAWLRCRLAMEEARLAQYEPDRHRALEQADDWNHVAAEAGDFGKFSVVTQLQQAAIRSLKNGEPFEVPDRIAPGNCDSALECNLAALALLNQPDARDQVVALLRKSVVLAPTDPVSWILFAEIESRAKHWSQAEVYAELATSLLPESPIPWYQRGMARLRSGRPKHGISDLRHALELDPQDHRVRMNLALALKDAGQLADAENEITAAIDGGFQDPRALLIRARVRKQLGKFAAAAKDEQSALLLPPLDATGANAIGIAWLKSDVGAARTAFQQAIHMDPANGTAWHNLAALYESRMDDSEAAIAALSSAIEIDAEDAYALAGRGVLYARASDFENAANDASLLEKLPLCALQKYQLACIYGLIDRETDRAVRLLKESFAEEADFRREAMTDPDLQPLRDLPAFTELIEEQP